MAARDSRCSTGRSPIAARHVTDLITRALTVARPVPHTILIPDLPRNTLVTPRHITVTDLITRALTVARPVPHTILIPDLPRNTLVTPRHITDLITRALTVARPVPHTILIPDLPRNTLVAPRHITDLITRALTVVLAQLELLALLTLHADTVVLLRPVLLLLHAGGRGIGRRLGRLVLRSHQADGHGEHADRRQCQQHPLHDHSFLSRQQPTSIGTWVPMSVRSDCPSPSMEPDRHRAMSGATMKFR